MRIAYTLKRAQKPSESYHSDQMIIEKARIDAQKRRPQEFIEQELGTEPIPVEDLLYQKLKL